MKPPLLAITAIVLAAGVAVMTAGPWAADDSRAASMTARSGLLRLPPAVPAGQLALYGQIGKLKRVGGHFELGFDPAWFTLGLTARRAKAEETGSSEVPNDSYAVEEGHRLLTYVVPVTTRVTVLTSSGAGITSTRIPVAELARIVNGGPHRKLFEPLASGVWIRVRIDAVVELDQQYQP